MMPGVVSSENRSLRPGRPVRVPESVPELVRTIRAEYEEMPCLCLTLPQAARLWGLDLDTCQRVLDSLSAGGFLRYCPRGYVRA
jgi:hypothetical protein